MTVLPRGVSVVVPAYNSELTLEELVKRLEAVLADIPKREVIIVDDGSRDATWPTIERIAAKNHRVRGINLMRNYGQHNALLCGIRLARYDVTVTIDDDLQHPPEELPKLLAALDGADVVYGRPETEQHGFARDLASRMTKIALSAAMGARNATDVSAFRAFRTQLREAFANYDGSYVVIDPMLAWGTQRFSAVTVRHEPRRQGKSNYNLRKLSFYALNLITTFSSWPLQIASLVGFGFTLLGLALLAYVVGRYLVAGSPVAGFPFLASVIAIFSGAQLFALGIMGEYLARVHSRSLSRPPFTIRETIANDRD
jgi:undecaprenyl-phosphate 4-deoxy-4-formamido-L-arabinose transferase